MSVQQAVLVEKQKAGGLPAGWFVGLFAFGLVLWWVASVMIRYGTPVGVFGRVGNVTVYAVTAMVAGLSTWLAGLRLHLPGRRLVDSVAIMTLAALFGDGVAIAWMPKMYGPDAAAMLPGLAWLSYTAACFLLASLTLVRR